MRQISTHVFYGLAMLNLYVDWSLYEVIPWYGILYLMFMGGLNDRWLWHAEEWMDSEYMRGDAAQDEMDEDMEAEEDMNNMIEKRFFNNLFKLAAKTLEHENKIVNAFKFWLENPSTALTIWLEPFSSGTTFYIK